VTNEQRKFLKELIRTFKNTWISFMTMQKVTKL